MQISTISPVETFYLLLTGYLFGSIDAYRTQRQSSQKPVQCLTPAGGGLARERPRLHPQPSVNSKERITVSGLGEAGGCGRGRGLAVSDRLCSHSC